MLRRKKIITRWIRAQNGEVSSRYFSWFIYDWLVPSIFPSGSSSVSGCRHQMSQQTALHSSFLRLYFHKFLSFLSFSCIFSPQLGRAVHTSISHASSFKNNFIECPYHCQGFLLTDPRLDDQLLVPVDVDDEDLPENALSKIKSAKWENGLTM